MPYKYIEVVHTETEQATWRMNIDHLTEDEVKEYVKSRYKKLRSGYHIEPHTSVRKLETGALYGADPDDNEEQMDDED